jgi:hypothetical protein
VVCDDEATWRADGPARAVSLRQLNRISALDVANAVIVAEAGATVNACRDAAAASGLWCPALRWLSGDATIGAAIAGGHGRRSRRYGALIDYLLGLKFACPAVGLVRHGGKAIKNASGYNLAGLVAGSRGEFGVVLEATIRLLPLPAGRRSRVYAFDSSEPLDGLTRLAGAFDGGRDRAALQPDRSNNLAAIEVAIDLPSRGGLVLVETEAVGDEPAGPLDLGDWGLRPVNDAPNQTIWPPPSVPGPTKKTRAGVNPGEVVGAIEAVRAIATRDTIQGELLIELTGGATELMLAGQSPPPADLCRAIGALPSSPAVNQLRAMLKDAVDPKRLLASTVV